MANRFVAQGLCTIAPTIQDAILYANVYIQGLAFPDAVQQTFEVWRTTLGIRKPKPARIQQLVAECRALHSIDVHMAGWINDVVKYGDSSTSSATIWINPMLVAAAEFLHSNELRDVIRVKLLHEFWHHLTPLYVSLCQELGSNVDATPTRVGTKRCDAAGNATLGDNGYAWEEYAIGGRLFLKNASTQWHVAGPLELEIFMGGVRGTVGVDNQWTTTGNNTQVGSLLIPLAYRIPTIVPHAVAPPVATRQSPRKHTTGVKQRDKKRKGAEADAGDEKVKEEIEERAPLLAVGARRPDHPDDAPDPIGHKS